MARIRKFIDIGANLTDAMYAGMYNGSKKHEPDLENVLQRSWDTGLEKIIITGGSLSESKEAIKIAQKNEKLYATVGCHPTRCSEFDSHPEGPDKYLDELKNLIKETSGNKVVAVGECGLDYDRLKFCSTEVQKKYFESQLKLSQCTGLPLFLHCRAAADDIYEILSKYQNLRGVIHSFDGTPDEAKRFLDLGYYIGLNGCSLKTQENLETVKILPKDKILIETDSPWCEIRPTHAGYKFISKGSQNLPSVKKEKWKADCLIKGRNEPANIRQVLDIISHVRNEPTDELGDTIYQNTVNLFFPN